MLIIDKTLGINDTTQNILQKHKDLQQFINSHCQIRHYSFQVRIQLRFLIELAKSYLLTLSYLFIFLFLID